MITGGIEEIVKHTTYFVMEILSCALCVYYVLIIIFYIISIDTFTYNHSYIQNKQVFLPK